MKTITTIFLLLTINSCSAQLIEWKENVKLEWKHFKGATQNRNVAAVTHCGIKVKPTVKVLVKGKATYTAIAAFTCDSSFYFPDKVDSLVLGHEQLHFDMAELYARKMRQRFAKAGFITPVEAQRIFNELHQEYFNFQVKIEDETNHGTKREEELKWEQVVDDGLKELHKFKQ